ncbi:MAG: indole-3-glycerol phosphate synthase TrpC [Hyphomonadaceae bacterium]|nr:indole-3-glycerol phosphate synthase TrpC [Clostridia bacterium]
MILDKIVASKANQLQQQKTHMSLQKMIEASENNRRSVDSYNSLKQCEGLAMIAEVKKASPSKGIMRENFNPVEIAKTYEKCSVQAISVLTESAYFMGDSQYLTDIREAVALPLLRKDFIIDPYQIYEAKVIGADAILLIMAILDDQTVSDFNKLATSLGLQCLVETHNTEEIKRASAIGANIIGVNNRNLQTFEVDIHTTENLLQYMPKDSLVISESGIQTHADMTYLKSIGVQGVLVGETFMRSADIEAAINQLRNGV